MNVSRNLLLASLSVAGTLTATSAHAVVFGTVGVYDENAVTANTVNTNGTPATAFAPVVLTAFNADLGGVIDFDENINTTTNPIGGSAHSATYGASNGKRLNFSTFATISGSRSAQATQGVSSSGSFQSISRTNGFTQSADRVDFELDFGALESVSDGAVLDDLLSQVAFTLLSRRDGAGGYPLDIRTTVNFSGGGAQTVTESIGSPSGSDDTFLSFSAGTGESISSIYFEAFETGTTTPVSTRIAIDDLGFVTVVPEPASLALLATGGLLTLGRRRAPR